jgi:hypothetical protein
VWAYTPPLGGGLSATISAEERRMNQTIDDSGVAAAAALAAFSRQGRWFRRLAGARDRQQYPHRASLGHRPDHGHRT